MRIAMLGTRGVPASYSGFETCVEELGQRLAARGHDVTVYCRSHHVKYEGDEYKGMRLVKLPTIANKYLDTIVHTTMSSFHALTQGYDVALYFIAGNSPVTWIPRLAGQKAVLNVDGLDWKREKWPSVAKRYIQFAEYLATVLPNAVITDSRVVQKYYRDRFGADTTYIAYGGDVEREPAGETLARFGLTPQEYILFVGRLVPENYAHHLVQAFDKLDTDMKCVIVGDAPYAADYQQQLRQMASDDRVVFTGYVFGQGYRELISNAYVFVETSGVGGTHPALLEAMAVGNCVVVHDTDENLETIGEAGFSYDGRQGGDNLREVLEYLIQHPDVVQAHRRLTLERVATHYTWDAVTDQYEALFRALLGAEAPGQ